ncbi:hypothetical protein KJ632_00640 [Patescibacteria group bacterium]|nr:hypothetical protein [Patescibacteria group bacterium]
MSNEISRDEYARLLKISEGNTVEGAVFRGSDSQNSGPLLGEGWIDFGEKAMKVIEK